MNRNELDEIITDDEFKSVLGKSKEDFLKLNLDGKRTLLTNRRNKYLETLDMGDSVNSAINDKINKITSIMDKLPQDNYEYGGSKKVTFIKDGKKNTRKVQVNKRGTKFVRFDGKDIPVSRLKLV